MQSSPYISFIVTSRNDDHGGNPLQRMQRFINALYNQCGRFKLPSELVVVEWNPPKDRPKLADAVCWPDPNNYLTTRIIEVPEKIHDTFGNSNKIPLFQMIAKNAGLRRCTGKFALMTNIDILFSDPLIRHISNESLVLGKSYRVDRCDIDAHDKVVRVNQKYGTYSPGILPGNLSNIMSGYKDKKYRELEFRHYGYPLIHTNTCGDFTLMGKQNMMWLGGYLERPIYSFHIDSLLLLAAYYSGIQEVCLGWPYTIYHMEHETGSGWSPEGAASLYRRLEKAGIPYLTWENCKEFSIGIRDGEYRKEGVVSLNQNDTWGLNGYYLEETVIGEP